MKVVKRESPLIVIRNPLRSVSLHIRDYQVTVKVKSPVPQSGPKPVYR